MITALLLKKTQLTPQVILDKDSNVFTIEGKSIYSNGYEFYKPILNWFEEYFKSPNKKTVLTIYFQYVNSSSFFQISMLVRIFSENVDKSKLKIIWKHDFDDEMIKENGFEFKENVNFDFEIIQVD